MTLLAVMDPSLVVGVAAGAFFMLVLLIFAWTFVPWLRAFTSGTPVSVLSIIGMRWRRIPVDTVLRFLIMARQAGVHISCREMESAYLQGVDLEKVTLAMIGAAREGQDLHFHDLVAAELAGRLAEKLGR